MNLNELKSLLADIPDRALRIQLSDGTAVPQYFHVTEVGQVTKNFIDCGGKTHATATCLLQTWLGSDTDHRLTDKEIVLRLGTKHTDCLAKEVCGTSSKGPATIGIKSGCC